MEVEEKAIPSVENIDEDNSKKGKILTLLFPTETQPAEGKDGKKDKNKPPTKVVVRRLPPRLTKETFLEEFSPLPVHDYFYFVRGDLSLGNHAFSRAYINFVNQDDIFAFKEKYDDYGIRDERGKAYHAVVEFAPFQRVPRRSALKKKLSKAGTLDADPKYLEFLQKLEDLKNNPSNTSEYFHETESSTMKTKITTTPLLEFLKQKKQKKIDLKNELRQRKREAEKERKRKEDEKRKAERERRRDEKGEKKSTRSEDKTRAVDDKSRKSEERTKDKKSEDRGKFKDEKRESKIRKDADIDSVAESGIPNDPAILKVVLRQSDVETKNITKTSNSLTEEPKPASSDTNVNRTERKYSDFRTRLAEEKQRKTFHRRDSEESRSMKVDARKGAPDEKGDSINVGNSTEARKSGFNMKAETKSKFRYSEQRNRDREYRNQKEAKKENSKVKNKPEMASQEETEKKTTDEIPKSSEKSSEVTHSSRRKSLEIDREVLDNGRRRSKSFHDVSNQKVSDDIKSRNKRTGDSETTQSDDTSRENDSEKLDDDSKKDPRAERRIRNKDRPSIEIYRPGMGRFSKQRLEQKKDETNSTSPTLTSQTNKTTASRTQQNKTHKKSVTKSDSVENKSPVKDEDSVNKNAVPTKAEVRTMTFTRSASKEN